MVFTAFCPATVHLLYEHLHVTELTTIRCHTFEAVIWGHVLSPQLVSSLWPTCLRLLWDVLHCCQRTRRLYRLQHYKTRVEIWFA